jgi:hypothetical protein
MASICLFALFRSMCTPRPSFVHAFPTIVHAPSLPYTPPIYRAPSFLLHSPPLHSRARPLPAVHAPSLSCMPPVHCARLMSTMRAPFLACAPSFLPCANLLKSGYPPHTRARLVFTMRSPSLSCAPCPLAMRAASIAYMSYPHPCTPSPQLYAAFVY